MIDPKDYSDIINLPRHISNHHPHMSNRDRAAQFSPFAALTGYEESINESKRIVNKKIELTDDAKEVINNKLLEIETNLNNIYKITYFILDKTKNGGEYITKPLKIKKIDRITKKIILSDKTSIDINNIIAIE